MNARILALVGALLLGLAVLVWVLRSSEDTGPRGAQSSSAPATGQPAQLEAPPEREAPLLSEPALAPEEARRAQSEPTSAARSWPAEETRWVALRLVAPAGTPAEERALVVALAQGGDYAHVYGKDGPLAALRAAKPDGDARGVLAKAEFERDGTARLGLPPEAGEAWLIVAGEYLYSLEPRRVEPAALSGSPAGGAAPGEVVELRPALGARISGRLRAPAGGPGGVAGVELELDWSINAALQLGAAGREALDLATASDDGGRFEFRAVPVGKPQTLTTKSDLARTFSADLAPAPGEHLRIELALLAGGSVRGRVLDESGAAIAGAEVEALGREFFGNPTAELRETESDAEGRFALTHLTPGKVWLHVEHADTQEHLGTPFDLADGEQRDLGDVVLSEGLVVAGRVRFPDGAPAEGTRVSVQPDLGENVAGSPMDPRAYIGARNDDQVDATGAFRIKGLGTGPWIVAAELELEEAQGARAPGRWSASLGLVRAPAPETQLTLEPPVTVSGTVLDGQRRPVGAFELHAERAGSQWYMPPSETKEQTFESADGRFLVTGLSSGKWTFRAEAEGYARSEKVARELPTDEELALVLLRPVLVAGTVVDPAGQPVAGAEVTKELEGMEAIQAMQGRTDWPVTQSDEQGAFRLESLPPGAGSIMAKKDGFAPSEGVPLELGEGEQKLDVVLRLRRGGTISGEVYDAEGKRASGSMVILQMPTLEQRRFTNTDARGEFTESGLKPGTWQVQAFPGIESLQGENGEALDQARLLAALKMTSVSLEDQEHEHVVLGVPPEEPVRVHGRITLGGEAVPGALVSFVPANGEGLDKLKVEAADAEGRYDLQLDAPGDYLLTVQDGGTPLRQNSVEFRRKVPEAEEFRLDVELPLGRISGRVEDAHGEPVSGARVTVTMQGGLVFGTVFGGNYTEAASDEAGAYEIPWLRPGRFTVAAGGAILGGALGGGAVLGREVKSVELREGESLSGLDFRLLEPGSVRGTVRDAAGNLVAEASIFLRDDDGHLVELFSLASTNASGTFEYPGLAPGDYTVTARTRTLASAVAVAVGVRSGESSEVTVALEPGTVLLVSLEDESGADVPSRVSVLDAKGREMNGMLALAELMERYSGGLSAAVQRVGPLASGTYEVRAIAEDGRSADRPVTLTGQSERKVKLRLK